MSRALPPSWAHVLSDELAQPYFHELMAFLDEERKTQQVFPPEGDVYGALERTPYEKVRVLLLGQDPYHDDGQAHGLCFSVRPGVKPPPSLVNVFKELKTDLGIEIPKTGCLIPWAEQGILLLNTILTVRAHQAGSHKNKGWERFTDAILRKVDAKPEPVVFVLWGNHAQKKLPLIDTTRHTVVKGAHPSPLSAKLWLGSKPFSQIDAALKKHGQPPIDWRL